MMQKLRAKTAGLNPTKLGNVERVIMNFLSCCRSLIQVLRTWLERYFKEDFYNPPHHHLLKRLRNLAEEFKQDEDLSEIFTSFDGECDFFTFTNSMVQQAEVKGLQEEACESEQASGL